MRHFAVAAIGRDRPGIAAAVSEILLEHGGNIEDSQMTILRGHFTVMLLVSTADDVDADALRTGLQGAGERLELEAVTLSEVSDAEPAEETTPSHIVAVYGVDHPGIVHAVTAALAERQVNITDLTTRLFGDRDGEPLYAMMLEIALPAGMSADDVEHSLGAVRQQQGVEVTVRPLEQDTL